MMGPGSVCRGRLQDQRYQQEPTFQQAQLRTLLFETAPHDVVSFAAATVVLCAVALVACAAPALRASRVSPITALRID